MKYCVNCYEHKYNDEFRKTKKTIDGLYPFCKQCSAKWQNENRSSIEVIQLQQWRDLQNLAFKSGAGTVVHTNKRIFMEWIAMNRNFRKLYYEWLEYKYGDRKLTIRLKHEKGNFEFANFEFYIRELHKGETMKVARYTDVNRVK